MDRNEVIAKLKAVEPQLRARRVAALYRFGSYARDALGRYASRTQPNQPPFRHESPVPPLPARPGHSIDTYPMAANCMLGCAPS